MPLVRTGQALSADIKSSFFYISQLSFLLRLPARLLDPDTAKECTYSFQHQFGIPCKHMIVGCQRRGDGRVAIVTEGLDLVDLASKGSYVNPRIVGHLPVYPYN